MNPSRDTTQLVRALRGHVDAFAEDLAGPAGTFRRVKEARPCAVAWVYLSALVAWAQDHDLIDPWWLRTTGEKTRAEMGAGAADWLAMSFASLAVHPATECLLDPRYSPLADGQPGDEVCEALLTWWAEEAPALSYTPTSGPDTLAGYLAGGLLQALSDERREGFALAQSPWWLADFLIARTLPAAAREFRDTTLQNIDPTCGTGHILIRMIDHLWELYTTGELGQRSPAHSRVTGWTPVPPAEAIKRIISGVHGCEIDPLTTAVARLRFVVAIGDLMHRSGLIEGRLRLDRIPPFQPVIVVGDALLARKVSKDEYARAHPKLAEIINLGYTSAPLESRPQIARARRRPVVAAGQGDLFDEEGAA